MSAPRIVAVEPPFSPVVADALARIMPPGVPPLALFRTLAVNERVFQRLMAGGLLDRGSISLRERELIIHRTCARLGSEYEWGVHAVFFAPKAGFSAADLAATCTPGPAASTLAASERLLFALVDELVDTSTVSDLLWSELARHWSAEQLVELVALVGYYHLIAFTTNAFRVPLEPFGARFSQPAESQPRRQLISSASPFETTIGFSRAVRVGNLVSVAGTAPLGADGATVGIDDAAEQMQRCIEIVRAALEQAGASLADVVRTRVMLTRIEDWPAVAKVHGEAFASIRPACTVVRVAGFIDPAWLVELEADAISTPA